MKIYKSLMALSFVFFMSSAFSQVTETEKRLMPTPENGVSDAVVLSEKCIFNDRFSNKFALVTRTIKVKVFTKKGIEEFGTLKLFDADSKSIKNFKGTIYLPNGDTITISEEDIKKKEVIKEWGVRVTEMSIAFPNLVPGSIIEYSYENTQRHLRGLFKWVFSNSVQTLYSEVQFIPSNEQAWAFYSQKPRAKAEVQQEEGKVTVIRKNIPPFVKEAFSLPEKSLKDAMVFYYFTFMESSENYWTEWGDDYYATFSESIKPNRRSKKIIKKKFSSIPRKDLIKAIYDYVQKNYLPLFTLTKEEHKKHDDAILKMYYNNNMSAQLSLKVLTPYRMMRVIACLIKTAAPEAKLQIAHYSPWQTRVLNRDIMSISQVPNKLLKVTLDGEVSWISPGKRLLPFGEFDYGAKCNTVILTGEGGTTFESLMPDKYTDNVTLKEVEVTITDENKVIIKQIHTLDPYASYVYRTLLLHLEKEQTKDLFQNVLEKAYGDDFELLNWDYRDLKDIYKPLILEMEYSRPYEFVEAGEHLFLELIGLEKMSENPFSSDSRKGVIIFDYPKIIKEVVHYTLPEGFKITSLPEYKFVNKSEFVYRMKFEQENEQSFTMKALKIVQTNIFPASKASFFYDTFSEIIRITNQKIIIAEQD